MRKLEGHLRLVQALTAAYNTALVLRSREFNPEAKDFGDAIQALPPEIFHKMRQDFRKQMEKINSTTSSPG